MSRTRFYILGFAALAAIDTTTQVSLKLVAARGGDVRAAAFSPWTYVAIAGYLLAFWMWMTLLEHAPVGPAFAASHIDVVTVLIVSVPLFGERLTPLQIGGAACIVAGILVLSRAATAGEGSAAAAPRATTPATAPESPAADRARSAGV